MTPPEFALRRDATTMSTPELSNFLENHTRRVEPLARKVNLAYWKATISGDPRDSERSAELQVELQRVYSDRRDFERISRWKDQSSNSDPLVQRQLDMLHRAFARNQIDPALNERITKLGSKIENQFNVYRAQVDGRSLTSNEILKILRESNDGDLRRNAWQAGKEVGARVESDLLTLVKLRNEAAASLGYANYYSMSLVLAEQDESEILNLFDELEVQTRAVFGDLKHDVDARLADRFGIGPDEIRPWHYEDPFFQEAPRVYEVALDKYYASADIVELVRCFYEGIGLEVDDILRRSDLYEKPGKDQHAYCTDIDRKGDIRILANIKSDETWAGTLLHEMGHAVHDKYIDPALPYLLRQEAHIFTTEAVAMLFGRLSKSADWIENAVGISAQEKHRITADLERSLRLHQLIFARWSQVMMRFERALYIDPDQDLNSLWWELAGEMQMLSPPDDTDFPHWAAKTHVVSAPVYYHNYLLGEILASQFKNHIRRRVLGDELDGSFTNRPEVGDYLKQRVFSPGARFRWDELVCQATGEPLSPKYFVREFVEP